MFFRRKQRNNHLKTKKNKYSKLHGSHQKLRQPEERRKYDTKYLKTKDETDRSSVAQLHGVEQREKSHTNKIFSEPKNETLQKKDNNQQKISTNIRLLCYKHRKSAMNPIESQGISLCRKTCKDRMDNEHTIAQSENPMSDIISSESTEELDQGGSDKRLQSILRDLEINESKNPSIDSNEKNILERKTKSHSINEIGQVGSPMTRGLHARFPNVQYQSKDDKKNKTPTPEVKYNNMTDNDKRSKVFLSLKIESRYRATLSERRKKGTNKKMYNRVGCDSNIVNSLNIISELEDRGSYRSISSCSLDSAILSKKQAVTSSPPLPPQPHQHQAVHGMLPPVILGPKQKDEIQFIGDKQFIEGAGAPTLIGIADEMILDIRKKFSRFFRECTSVS